MPTATLERPKKTRNRKPFEISEHMDSRGPRRYSVAFKQAVVGKINEGVDRAQIARDFRIPKRTVDLFKEDYELFDITSPDVVGARKKTISLQFLWASDSCLSSISPEKLERMSPAQAIFSASIAIDKYRLLENQPTAITDTRNMHVYISTEMNKFAEIKQQLIARLAHKVSNQITDPIHPLGGHMGKVLEARDDGRGVRPNGTI